MRAPAASLRGGDVVTSGAAGAARRTTLPTRRVAVAAVSETTAVAASSSSPRRCGRRASSAAFVPEIGPSLSNPSRSAVTGLHSRRREQRRRGDLLASAATTTSSPSTSTSSSSSRKASVSSPWPSALAPPPPPGTVADVDEIIGVRVVVGDEGRPQAQYLVKWSSESSSKKRKEKKKEEKDDKNREEDLEGDGKDPHPAPTWEPTANVADNLLRDYEDRWWRACREGDAAGVRKMLAGGAKVLACCVDDSRRSGLHYAAGKGSAEAVALLCAAGAKLDLADKEGYTPLHMAVGYSHTECVAALLDAGADPEVADRAGRDVVRLVESIRAATPPAPELMARRVALEQAAALLADHLFEEIEPKRILRARRVPIPTPPGAPTGTATIREFLVQWPDGKEDSWVPQGDLAQDVVDDFDAGLDYAPAAALLRERVRGDGREFLVSWEGEGEGEVEDSWEPEENVAVALVQEWDERRRSRAAELATRSGKEEEEEEERDVRKGGGVMR